MELRDVDEVDFEEDASLMGVRRDDIAVVASEDTGQDTASKAELELQDVEDTNLDKEEAAPAAAAETDEKQEEWMNDVSKWIECLNPLE